MREPQGRLAYLTLSFLYQQSSSLEWATESLVDPSRASARLFTNHKPKFSRQFLINSEWTFQFGWPSLSGPGSGPEVGPSPGTLRRNTCRIWIGCVIKFLDFTRDN